MTYLQLVNRVLRRLRERSVASINTDYALLIGEFVNEAKEDVERAHKWKARRVDTTFPTVVGQQDYNLGAGGVASTATNERSQLVYAPMGGGPMVYNLTSPYAGNQLQEVPREQHKAWIADGDASNTQPYHFSLFKDNDGWRMSIYPKPDGVYTIQATFYIPQDELDDESDELAIPADPVWRLALAYATAERGEGVGAVADRYEARAQRALIEAISRESEDAELTFYEE